ncbi:MAG: AAA family ATPase [Ruminococcus sp.]|nr:AAA family ATPase [Ruminococcus sp.]
MTALNASVGAEAGQPIINSNNHIINENYIDFNSLELNCDIDEAYLHTVSMDELYNTVYDGRPPIIDGLLYTGTYLFVGAPKLGKSFLMAQLAYHISTGTPFWNYPVRKGTVLYLALEDDYRRLQKRLYQMFGTESTENLYFSVSASQLGNGLDEQLQSFVDRHSDTRLIIIDTLQKVREVGADYSYGKDYEIVTRLKKFADSNGVCVILVHHTRKQKSDDTFDMISGTNGLLGAADGAFVLQKEKRTANSATLEISGRDQQDQKLYLTRNTTRLIWELDRVETELWKEPPEPVIEAVAELVTEERSQWCGSPTELVKALGLDISANSLTRNLNINSARLFNEKGIRYYKKKCHEGRRIILAYEGKRDDM